MRRMSRDLFRVQRVVALVIAGMAAFIVTLTASGAPTSLTLARFVSPSRNLSCEMADRDGRGSYVHCQSKRLAHSVRMSPNGRLRLCRGASCLGDPAANTRVSATRSGSPLGASNAPHGAPASDARSYGPARASSLTTHVCTASAPRRPGAPRTARISSPGPIVRSKPSSMT
jgi:hypothetical protein